MNLITVLEVSASTERASWSVELPVNSPIIHTATLRKYLFNKSYNNAYQQPDNMLKYRQFQEQLLYSSSSPSPQKRSTVTIRDIQSPLVKNIFQHHNLASFVQYNSELPETVVAIPARTLLTDGGLLLSTISSDSDNSQDTFQSRSIVIDTNGVSDNEAQQSQSYDNHIPLSEHFPGEAMPSFDFGMPRNITARTGHTEAIIKCRVDKLEDKSVRLKVKKASHSSDCFQKLSVIEFHFMSMYCGCFKCCQPLDNLLLFYTITLNKLMTTLCLFL